MFGECDVAVARSRVRSQRGGVDIKGDVDGACEYRYS